MRTWRHVTLWAVLAVFSAAAWGQEYQIKLDRPAKAGESLTRATTITGKLHIAAKDGQTVMDDRTNTYVIDYAAEVTVLEVDSTGNVTKDTHRIIRCRRMENDVATEYFQPGTIIVASLDSGREVFTKDDKAVTTQQADVLRTLIALGSTPYTEDEMFGTSVPRKAGDSWPVNAQVGSLELAGRMPRAPQYSGQVWVVGPVEIGGVNCIEVQADMSNPNFAPVAPKGVSVVSGTSSLHTVTDCPLDLTLPILKRRSLYKCDFQTYAPAPPGSAQQARAITVDTNYEKETVTSITNVKL
jgi:hypothetical protein